MRAVGARCAGSIDGLQLTPLDPQDGTPICHRIRLTRSLHPPRHSLRPSLRSALPRERVRSVAHSCLRSYATACPQVAKLDRPRGCQHCPQKILTTNVRSVYHDEAVITSASQPNMLAVPASISKRRRWRCMPSHSIIYLVCPTGSPMPSARERRQLLRPSALHRSRGGAI
jgi:hypothetical protein